ESYFFGYGSLVNCDTHQYENYLPARVKGWRRKWRHTSLRDVAYLTVAEAKGHSIDGLIAAVPNGDWVALDIREMAYDRLQLSDQNVSHKHPDPISVQMYKTKPGNDAAPNIRHPILLSYLETVIKGYLDVFGESGVDDFFETTDGWDSPIQDDRSSPIYPRHVSLTDDVRCFVDEKLDSIAVRIKQNQPYRRW
ncbi:MAG: hypothetical protein ACJAXU_002021, partial [Paracoccaceae bacterium]